MKEIKFEGKVGNKDGFLEQMYESLNGADLMMSMFVNQQSLIQDRLYALKHNAEVAKENIESYFNIPADQREKLSEDVLKLEIEKFNKSMSALIPALCQNLNMIAEVKK